jgi:hypothetical protein
LSDILTGIGGILSNSWRFLMNTYIPATEISFGAMFIGLALIPVGFTFLSFALGHNIGEASTAYKSAARSSRYLKSKARENDTH